MPSTRLTDCVDALQAAYSKALPEFEQMYPGYTAIITCTRRSPEEQQALYAQGRTKPGLRVTQIDGVTQLSKHNADPARALDFAVVFNGKIAWNDLSHFGSFATLAKKYGVQWGGDWPHFKDYPHLEVA